MNLAELGTLIAPLEQGLHQSYRTERRAAPTSLRTYLDHLDEFTLRGGKRFRALLVLAGYHLVNGRTPRPALRAAEALEHFQSWMLIHDDIIDHSELRRGGPTLHRLLSKRGLDGLEVADPDDLGRGLGITLGDLEEPFTVQALLASSGPAARRLRVLSEYVRMTRLTAYGQLMDIRNGARPIDRVSESDVLLVHRLKSAVYSVSSPLVIGALLAGGRDPLLEELRAIGDDLGVAFQLRDDMLGTGFGPENPGKSANDLIEGKRTLLVVRAWHRGSSDDRATLARVLGRPAATPAEIAAAKSVIESTGSRAYSEVRIAALEGRALRRLDRSRRIAPARKPLVREIADRLIRRNR
ncbi:MAG: polyprenyl synthetase family protein [Thermoplasmata archaeon]|jgi:geranylgeranyl diphosphate synthase type I